ncbi:MAG: adhesin [Bacteroidota bacterium]
MEEKGNNKVLGREDLKKHFRNGQVPTEYDFGFLIDSMINKQDDGFRKENENGLVISTTGNSKKLVTFLKNVNDLDSFFTIEKDEQGTASMRFNPAVDSASEDAEDKSFFFGVEGCLGIGKRSEENLKLDVDGFSGLKGRVGTHASGCVPADGKWHSILEGLDNCSAFEVMARTGKKGTGKFAILHAFALSAFGRSKSRIRKTSAHYGFFWNKLNLRFRGTTHNYSLQLRTNTNYGSDIDIYYKITNLWDDESFMPKDYYNS